MGKKRKRRTKSVGEGFEHKKQESDRFAADLSPHSRDTIFKLT